MRRFAAVTRGYDHAGRRRATVLDSPRLPFGICSMGARADTVTIDLGGEDARTVRRTTTQPVRSIKAHRPRKAAHVS